MTWCFSWSQRSLVGFRFGDMAGNSIWGTPTGCRCMVTTWAQCGGTLSFLKFTAYWCHRADDGCLDEVLQVWQTRDFSIDKHQISFSVHQSGPPLSHLLQLHDLGLLWQMHSAHPTPAAHHSDSGWCTRQWTAGWSNWYVAWPTADMPEGAWHSRVSCTMIV